MVCEVAISQTLKSVMEKKHPYLLGSKNKVRFLIIICLRSEKPIHGASKKRIRDDQPPQPIKCSRSTGEVAPLKSREEPQRQLPVESAEDPPLPSKYKSGCVFVYTTSLQPSTKTPSRRVRSIKTLVENLVSNIYSPKHPETAARQLTLTRNSGPLSRLGRSH